MQSLIFRVLGGSLLTLAIVWALVLAWWQSNDHHPEPFELMLYLGVLPLALVGGYWLLRGFIEHLGRGAAALAADHLPAKDDDPLSRERMQSAAAERGMTVHLLDAFVASAGGNSGDAVLAAVNAGKRPEPNASLVDNDGFPVFAASISDPDVAALADELAERESCVAALGERQDIVRALVLLDNVLESATQGLASVLARCPHQLHVQLVWLIPADWDLSHQAELRRWIGTRSWPAAVPTDLEIHLIPTASEADAMRQLDEVIVAVNRDASPERLVLLMGAVSAVDQRTVEEWAAEGILFSGAQQDRQIPGEGAAVLMLAAPSTSAMLGCADAVAVTRVGHGLRESALNAGGRIGGRLIEQLAAGLLEVSGMAASSVQAVVSDTDHRAAHIVEMLEGLGTTFEHLDPLKDCLAVGAVTGALTPIGSLLALVCAHQRALVDAAPVLCLSNQHLRERAALLVMPCGAGADAAPFCS